MSALRFGVELLGLIILIWLIASRIVRRFYHFPVPFFVGRFLDSPIRTILQKPSAIADRLMLEPSFSVMDLGCGPGTFTFKIARRLYADGFVCAVDIQSKMIRTFKKRIDKKGIRNIEPIVASALELPFRVQSLDRVAMVTVLAEIPNRIGALEEIRRVLKPHGILSISEFLPDPDYPLRRTVKKWCIHAGFQVRASYGTFFTYTINFEKVTLKKA